MTLPVNVRGIQPRILPLASGTLIADGTEQTLIEYSGVARISGYIDLQNMESGDTIIIRYYVKFSENGEYKKYYEDSYSGAQSYPALYFAPRESYVAIKITLQQTSGAFKSFQYNFLREV